MALDKHSCHSAGDWLSRGVTEAGREGQAETGLLGPWGGVWVKLTGEQVRASKGCKCTLVAIGHQRTRLTPGQVQRQRKGSLFSDSIDTDF